jgi:thymidine kinase
MHAELAAIKTSLTRIGYWTEDYTRITTTVVAFVKEQLEILSKSCVTKQNSINDVIKMFLFKIDNKFQQKNFCFAFYLFAHGDSVEKIDLNEIVCTTNSGPITLKKFCHSTLLYIYMNTTTADLKAQFRKTMSMDNKTFKVIDIIHF